MMFRTAELGQRIPKAEFKQKVPVLREELLTAQRRVRKLAQFPVIIVFAGVNGAGKGETVNLLNEWMDPRWLVTRAYDKPSDEELERPEFWRFWRDLPPYGRIGLFLSSWYSRPVLDRVHERIDEVEFNKLLDNIINFEKALADDGALILKFWMHLSKKEQKKRFKELEKDDLNSWRIKEVDWDNWRMYEKFEEAAERVIMKTSTGESPWCIVEGTNRNFRSLTVGTVIRDEINKHLEKFVNAGITAHDSAISEKSEEQEKSDNISQLKSTTVLAVMDMSLSLPKKQYTQELKLWQAKLNQLQRNALEKKQSTILLFEGPDAGGKGGAIRRLTAALDARHYQVLPIAAPTDEEKAHHYLWRFWRHLPRAGKMTIFDRSWYGRVLVERVEDFASEEEWRRAYAEINAFEEMLTDSGIVLLKFWIHVTKEEQYRRFKEREVTPHKQWKLTDEDWRNREKWEQYELAVNDIVEHTSTRVAPWNLIEGNDKRHARIKVIKTVCNRMEEAQKGKVKGWNNK
jgi:polyphosphate:AMP phosphotransferase